MQIPPRANGEDVDEGEQDDGGENGDDHEFFVLCGVRWCRGGYAETYGYALMDGISGSCEQTNKGDGSAYGCRRLWRR